MLMKVVQFPLVKITICFVLGIIFSHITKPNLSLLLILLSFGLVLLAFFYFKNNKFQSPFFGIITLFTSFILGAFILSSNNETLHKNHYLHQITQVEKEISSQLIIEEKLKNTLNNDRYVAKVIELNNKKSYGKIILNIKKNETLPNIEIGSTLLVSGSIYKNRIPNNIIAKLKSTN